MHHIRPAFRASILTLALLALAGCSGDRAGGLGLFGSSGPATEAAAPSQPPINMAGLWTFSSPGRGRCLMTFGTTAPTAGEGTIAPQGGCPGKFYMSRKWVFEGGALSMRDHTGKPLAQLASTGAGYEGKSTGGEAVMLSR